MTRTNIFTAQDLPSGTKIQLSNRSANGTSFKWEVYYDGIKMATSTVESPLLYVYPTHFDKELHIFCKGKYDYVLYNTLGIAVLSGQGNDNTTITTEGITPGYYTIVVNGEERKFIK